MRFYNVDGIEEDVRDPSFFMEEEELIDDDDDVEDLILSSNVYHWMNYEKSRYYTITVNKDGATNIVLNYRWGGCNSNRGGKKNIFVQNEDEVQQYINQMMRRRKSRGYELVCPVG